MRKRVRLQTGVGERSRTLQSFGAESDINAIMRKYASTGDIGVLLKRRPEDAIYGDFTNVMEYSEALARVRRAEELFGELPSEVRDACGNETAGLLELVFDPARREEAERLGLLVPSAKPVDQPPPVAPAPAVPPGEKPA